MRFDQCTETCTTDCGHCKGRPVEALRAELWRAGWVVEAHPGHPGCEWELTEAGRAVLAGQRPQARKDGS